VISGICTALLISLFLACCGPSGTGEITANVKSVDSQAGMITLATGIGCGLTQPSTVKFDRKTDLYDLNGHKLDVSKLEDASKLEHATRVSFMCGKEGRATKITIKGKSQEVKCVDFQKSTITLHDGEGCGSTSPATVKFDRKTHILDLGDHKLELSDLVRATNVSFECVEKSPVKKITINGTSENVKSVDLQSKTITLAGNVACGPASPPMVKFDINTDLYDLNGHKLDVSKQEDRSKLEHATIISFECVDKDLVKKIAIRGTSDRGHPLFSLGQVIDSVVAKTEPDRFSGVEGDMTFEDGALKWKVGFRLDSDNCWVIAGDSGPNYLRCDYENPSDSQVADLFEKVQQTMSTFHCFHLDEGRSSQSVRTYTDPDNRVRVSVKACIPSKEPRDRVKVEACTLSKPHREGVEVKECVLTVEVIPTPH
jgi:hypothetical protein